MYKLYNHFLFLSTGGVRQAPQPSTSSGGGQQLGDNRKGDNVVYRSECEDGEDYCSTIPQQLKLNARAAKRKPKEKAVKILAKRTKKEKNGNKGTAGAAKSSNVSTMDDGDGLPDLEYSSDEWQIELETTE